MKTFLKRESKFKQLMVVLLACLTLVQPLTPMVVRGRSTRIIETDEMESDWQSAIDDEWVDDDQKVDQSAVPTIDESSLSEDDSIDAEWLDDFIIDPIIETHISERYDETLG